MRNKLFTHLLLPLVALVAAPLAPAYDLIRGPGGALVTWNSGTIPLVIRMPQTPTFQDGTNYATSVQAAIAAWNAQLANVQLSGQIVAPGAAADNGLNEIVLASQIYGDDVTPPEDFGPNVLAVTLSYRSSSPRGDGSYQRLESDILFNTAVTGGWDSYRGNLQYPEDIRRVAIHELGHLLGLDHPDEAGQTVAAVMNSTVSNTDALQNDDLIGAQFLYGRPGGWSSPANNHFANATAITLVNNGAQASGSSVGANKEAGEPNHAPDEPGGASVWWRWTAPANGTLTVTTAGSHFDTLLAVYTGGAVNSLTQLAANDDVQSGVVRTSTATISVTSGTTYYFAVDGWEGEWGSVQLNLSFVPSGVAPTITQHPADRTVNMGFSTTFTVAADGSAPLSYQWQVFSIQLNAWLSIGDGISYSGTNSATLTIQGAGQVHLANSLLHGNQYRCVVSNTMGSSASNAATLSVNMPPEFSQHPVDVVRTSTNGSVQFTVAVSGRPVPSLTWQHWPAGGSGWSNLQEGGNYTGTLTGTLTVSNLTLAMNGDRFRCVATNSVATVFTTAGQLNIGSPPAIQSHPPDQTLFEGGSFALTVTLATGNAPFTFRWYRNGVQIPNADAATYSRSGAVLADSGNYHVVVENIFGIVTSSQAVVTVNPLPPVITQQPAGQDVFAGDRAVFSVAATSSTPLSYAWQTRAAGTESWVSLADGGSYSGVNTATLTVDPALRTMDGDEFRCAVTSAAGTTASQPASLAVAEVAGVVAVAATSTNGYFLRYDGTLWTNNFSTRRRDLVATGVALVSAGQSHVMFVKSDRTLWGVGSNYSGELGDGTTTTRATPVLVASDVVAVSAGAGFTLFLKSNGTLWVTGTPGASQFRPGLTPQFVPVQVAEGVAGVAARAFTLFLRTDGTLWGLGNDNSGQLGDGGYNVYRAQPVLAATGVQSAWAGSDYSLYLKDDHTLWFVGNNQSGHQPIDTDVSLASAGSYHFTYIKRSGELRGGGSNGSGQLGLGQNTTTWFGNPWSVGIDQADVVDVTASAGALATLFAKADGSTWGVGTNLLGDGSQATLYYSLTQGSMGSVLPPTPVADLGATQGTTDVVRLAWSPVIAAQTYRIYRATVNNPGAAQLAATVHKQSIWHDRNVEVGQTYFYWVASVNPSGESAWSAAVSGSAISAVAPTITSEPASVSVGFGGSAVFSISATGFPSPTYLWQSFNADASKWVDIGSDAVHSGLATPTLIVTGATTTKLYRCVVRNSGGSVNSAAAQLTVVNGPQAPVIVTQPVSRTILQGGATTFSVTATGSDLSYRWQLSTDGGVTWLNYVPLEISTPSAFPRPLSTSSGWTSATLSLSLVDGFNGRLFRCLVSNFDGLVYSNAVSLTVTPAPPAITVPPLTQYAALQQGTSLSVTATGLGTLSYQWFRNGVPVDGATGPNLVIPAVTTATVGYYEVQVTNAGGTTAVGASVILIEAPEIVSQPIGTTIFAGTNSTLRVEAQSFVAITYQWYRVGVPIEGATSPELSLVNISPEQAGDYTVEVTNIAGTTISNVATLTVLPATAPVITQQPVSRLVMVGSPITFAVQATGEPGPDFRWQRLGSGASTWVDVDPGQAGVYSGANTPILALLGGTLLGNHGDRYRCVVSNVAGTVISAEATLSITSSAAPLLPGGGYNFAAFLRLDGSVWAMGRNQEGQLGDGTAQARLLPVQSHANVVALAAGADHLAVIKADGTLWTTGYNPYGALGDGSTLSRSSFAQIATGVSRVAAGVYHTLFTKTDGTLWTVGWNAFGQLGDGSLTNRLSPYQITGEVTALAGSYAHSLYVKSDGTLWAMGTNGAGQFGNGTTTGSLAPLQVGTDAREVAAGYYHSLFIDRSGTLWAAGNNGYGQLGDGTLVSRPAWVTVADGVVAAAAGVFHSVFLKSDGTLWAMGANERGQLGTGDTVARSTPVQVASGVASVSAGLFATYFTKTDGTLWVTGANDQGQLGDGSTVDRASYVLVASGGNGLVSANPQPSATNSSTATHVTLTWPHVIGATHYRVLRGPTTSRASAVPLAERVTGNFYVDRTGLSGVTYYYWVQAVNSAGALDTGGAASGRHGVALTPPAIATPPAAQFVTVGADVTFAVVATGSAPLSYQWRRDGENIPGATAATLLLEDVTIAAAGAYDVVVSNAAGSVTSAVATLTVNKLSQTITFAALADRTYTDVPFALTATASSGLPVSFTLSSGPANLTVNQLTLTGAGSITVTAAQAGDDTYQAATPVSRTFTVSKVPATVTLGSLSATYDGTPKTVTASTTPAGLALVMTYDGSATAPTNAGTYAIVATIDHALYQGTASGTLTIARAPQSITFAPLSDRLFTSDPMALSATSSAGLPIVFSLLNGDGRIENGQLLLDAPGSFTVRASQAGDANHLAADPVDRSFVVTTSLDSWALEHFTAEELLDPAVSGPNADPDGDGFANLLEYALGLDPRTAATNGLPEIGVVATDLAYTYTRPVGRSELTYSVQFSTNLTSWTSEGVTHELVSTVNGVETWRGHVPLSTGANLFLRLRVERP